MPHWVMILLQVYTTTCWYKFVISPITTTYNYIEHLEGHSPSTHTVMIEKMEKKNMGKKGTSGDVITYLSKAFDYILTTNC